MDKNILNFLENEEFINSVVYPTGVTNEFWKNYLQLHPEEKGAFTEASQIVQSLLPREKNLSAHEIQQIWDNVNLSKNTPVRKIRLWNYVAAASVFTAIVACSLFYFLKFGSEKVIDYNALKAGIKESDEIKLVLDDNTLYSFSQSETEFTFDSNGTIRANSKVIRGKHDNENSEEKFNQLLVPRGKRSSVLLSDGTKIWLNAGSRIIFPAEFAKEKRELFIEGEAFLNVTHTTNPFIVKTQLMDVQVLGTSFNINAYPEEGISNIVLVEGKVKASVKNHADSYILPNQKLCYNIKDEEVKVSKVDVQEYISWKEGWLLVNSEKLEKVFEKLSRYYNRSINIKDDRTGNLLISGKIDLKDSIEQVLKVIAKTSPIKIEKSGNQINISSK